MVHPNREAAQKRLDAFLPRAGGDYARTRNYDDPRMDNVSKLSPWLRLRVITEWDVISATLEAHSKTDASKFIDEICWRTYWKGWLELRPQVWDDYLEELANERQAADHDGRYRDVITSQSGIECMDAWSKQLISTGYLHNHARMWFASIWIHTLKLPWVLGADFFLKHLLDGDAASNTLSWRWVAGLHTEGKTYLAKKSNIENYTNGRFSPETPLARYPATIKAFREKPSVTPLPDKPMTEPEGKIGLLVHEEDLSVIEWITDKQQIDPVAGLFPAGAYADYGIAEPVINFRRSCMQSCLSTDSVIHERVETFVEWAKIEKLNSVLMATPPVGLWNGVWPELESRLHDAGIRLCRRRHWWDAHFYPHARAGFFRFKKAIPDALENS